MKMPNFKKKQTEASPVEEIVSTEMEISSEKPEKKAKIKKEKVKKEKKPEKAKKEAPEWMGKVLAVLKEMVNVHKIRTTIVGAFLVPVIFIVILGVASYQKASNTIIESYKESSLSTISAESMYFTLLCDTVSAKTSELVRDTNTSSYYQLYFDSTDAETMEMFKAIKTGLQHAKSSADYVSDYFIVASKGNQISSRDTALPDDAYTALYESDTDGVYLSVDAKKNKWLGRHAYIDGVYGTDDSGYGLVYYQRFLNADALLIMDVSMETIEEALAGMDFGPGGYKAVVAPDGREIVFQNTLLP